MALTSMKIIKRQIKKINNWLQKILQRTVTCIILYILPSCQQWILFSSGSGISSGIHPSVLWSWCRFLHSCCTDSIQMGIKHKDRWHEFQIIIQYNWLWNDSQICCIENCKHLVLFPQIFKSMHKKCIIQKYIQILSFNMLQINFQSAQCYIKYIDFCL